ncbi:FeoA domain-containing protein [Candidatus Woesearchaeota archaeon]|nr:FeoA domain-containing protein [Candidatus Woesearchaeota archaeon]
MQEDALRILCEKNKNISLEFLKNEINVAQLILSEALKELQKKNLITIQENSISLTEMGQKRAKTILEKHLALENYFEKTESKIEPHTAAHIIEHYVSREVISNIKKLSNLKKGGIPLTQFELDKEGLIAEIVFSDYKLFERAVSMGIFPGEKIIVLSVIPSGIVLKINHKKFALDRSIAKGIKAVEYGKF